METFNNQTLGSNREEIQVTPQHVPAVEPERKPKSTPARQDSEFFQYCFDLTMSGKAHAAITLLQEAWDADPDDCAAGHVLSIVLTMSGQRKRALEEIDKVLARFPYFVPGHCQRTHVLLDLKKKRETLIAARAAVSLSPKD